jgi:hypothetical protein
VSDMPPRDERVGWEPQAGGEISANELGARRHSRDPVGDVLDMTSPKLVSIIN